MILNNYSHSEKPATTITIVSINPIFSLDTDNVFEYLAALNYCKISDRDLSSITVITAKNFNLLISLSNGTNLLVKQEIHNDRGKSNGEFWSAWQIQKMLGQFPDFGAEIEVFLPKILHFDPHNSILIVNYLTNYSDLYDYHASTNLFPVEIAQAIGRLLGTLHGQTFQQSQYERFFNDPDLLARQQDLDRSWTASHTIRRLARITPQVLQMVPPECWQFFRLYQRFPSLSQAIAALGESITPSCLVHNDLKINNILLDLNWAQPKSPVIRLIDWERASWGDPASDLGSILGSYLELWLEGLIVSSSLSMNESLQLATTPLELIQPSLFATVSSYLESFSALSTARPDAIERAIQFAGLALIQRIEGSVYEDRLFGNRQIMMLQVAKQLICTPQAAMNTLFGDRATQLITK